MICQLQPNKAAKSHLKGLLKQNTGSQPTLSDSVGWGGRGICISVNFPGEAPVCGSRTTLQEPLASRANFQLLSVVFKAFPGLTSPTAGVSVPQDQLQARGPSGLSTLLSCFTVFTHRFRQVPGIVSACHSQGACSTRSPLARRLSGGGRQRGSDQAAARDLSYHLGCNKPEPFQITPGYFYLFFIMVEHM